VEWIVDELNKLGSKARVEVCYEEETPNFMGVELYKGPACKGVVDYLSEGEHWGEQTVQSELDAADGTDDIWKFICVSQDTLFEHN
jgi:hypothetical protein